MLHNWVRALQERAISRLELLAGRPRWLLELSLSSALVCLFLSFPSLDVFARGEFESIWCALDLQIGNPFKPHAYEPSSHEAKMALRLTVPVLVHAIGGGRSAALALNVFAGILIFPACFLAIRRVSGDAVVASLIVMGLAGLPAGAAAFCDLRGVFDPVSLVLLLGILIVPTWLIVPLLTLAVFNDERSALTLPFLWAVEREFKSRRISLFVGACLYTFLRLWIQNRYGLHTPMSGAAGVGLGVLVSQVHTLPLGGWTALEGLWGLPVSAIAVAALRRNIGGLWLAGGLALVLGAAMSVIDVTRSSIYAVLALPLTVQILADSEEQAWLRTAALWGAGLSLSAPTLVVGGSSVIWLLPAPLQFARVLRDVLAL